MFQQSNALKKLDDTELVLASIGGDKEAFCAIVSRYQNLLCSLAYSSIGDLKHSEDLAQDVFVEAWQKLDTLRDPKKLKSWLCGILRFKISHFYRAKNKQLTAAADALENHSDTIAGGLELESEAIDAQHQGLLWDTLSTIDITYREPLVLFYREQQSVEKMADSLSLSLDTAKQRLSRGRKLLKTAMATILEETLEKSKPGTAFTAGVFVLIEDVTKHAAAASFGASAVKAGSMFKSAGLMAGFATLSGFISAFFGLRAGLYQSRTQNERRLTIKVVCLFFLFAAIFVASMFGLMHFAGENEHSDRLLAFASQCIVLVFIISYFRLMKTITSTMGKLRAQERIFYPEAFAREVDQEASKKREYKSALRLFNIPLFHFKFGMPEAGETPAKAWFAGGSIAYGVMFAWGGLAVAPISVGIVTVGIVSCGAISFGVLSVGTVAIGLLAFGASAIAYKAYASLSALGWESALSGGFSIAKEAAVGQVAIAANTNDKLAYELANYTFFGEHYAWILVSIAILVVVPAYYNFKEVKRRLK